jgi:hypothetical protein
MRGEVPGQKLDGRAVAPDLARDQVLLFHDQRFCGMRRG